MRKNNLTENKGLSLSQATSVSNQCFQRAANIDRTIASFNNYSKSVKIDGEKHVTENGVKIPDNIVDLILEKASLHACQAFLMENIKAKDAALTECKTASVVIKDVSYPNAVDYFGINLITKVVEEWGWEKLTASELNEFVEAEAFASHIGQFIHKNSVLDKLRVELPKVPALEWMEVHTGVKSPVTIVKHHTDEDLLKLHEKLAFDHRKHEQRVNYFKAKVKDLVTNENARIAKLNSTTINEGNAKNAELEKEYNLAYRKANNLVNQQKAEFEKTRQADIKTIASTRILVDARFQKTVDLFLIEFKDKK